jgi:hypothetical protein
VRQGQAAAAAGWVRQSIVLQQRLGVLQVLQHAAGATIKDSSSSSRSAAWCVVTKYIRQWAAPDDQQQLSAVEPLQVFVMLSLLFQ